MPSRVAAGESAVSPDLDTSQLDSTIMGDALGKPVQFHTHFADPGFNRSAYPTIRDHVLSAYPTDIDLVGLGSASAAYELEIARLLELDGKRVRSLTVVDLQPGSMADIQPAKFPIRTHVHDLTDLAGVLPAGATQTRKWPRTLALSRAIEHYNTPDQLHDMLAGVGHVLDDRGLYIAQLSSGNPDTLGALEAALVAIAGKTETFYRLDDYRAVVQSVRYDDGTPIFEEVGHGQADTQAGRGALAQAGRYLNNTFLRLVAECQGQELPDIYADEVRMLDALKADLEHAVALEPACREDAIARLHNTIEQTHAYQDLFKPTYLTAVVEYLNGLGHEPADGTTIVRDGNGVVQDVLLDVEYPMFVWRKRPQQNKP